MIRCAVQAGSDRQAATRSFSLHRGLVAAAMLVAAQGASACQPSPPPPPPPPPLYGETHEEYVARVAAIRLAEIAEAEAARRAARLAREGELWASADRIIAVQVIAAPRIRKENTKGRDVEIVLRPLAVGKGGKGGKAAQRIKLRYRMQFSICGYYGADYFTDVAAGDLMVLFAGEGKLSGKNIADGTIEQNAVHPETLALLAQARTAL